ncbi:MAG: PKD domain-containing protein [Acidobacteria bacterium]|nr:PKD domain-containing protein [Acidobacteriota bacterium]
MGDQKRFWILLSIGVLLVSCGTAWSAGTGTGYKIMGFNDLGMHCMDDSYEVFSILPPYNTIHAQLVDPSGHLVKQPGGITMTYEAVADPAGSINTSSAGKTNFWQFVTELFGASPPVDEGLTGSKMPGSGNVPQPMQWDGSYHWFTAEAIPLTPYDDAGAKSYYPMMRLVARDSSGQVLAISDIVLPVSDEMDCRTCHASGSPPDARPADGWVFDPDPVRDYRLNVLLIHDDRQLGTPLFQSALADAGYSSAGLYDTVVNQGTAVLCARCHGSNALAGTGMSGIPALTRAIHSMHAYVTDPVTGMALEASANRSACYRCHPGSETRCLRGAMGSATTGDASLAIQCQSCHGSMSMVGASTRQGWFDEPTCQSCHTGTADNNSGRIRYLDAFDAPGHYRQAASAVFATNHDTPAAGYSLFRFSTGHGGLQCEACHGSTHAIFPSSHENDDIRNVQLQGHGGTLAECASCHGSQPNTVDGGPHGMHPVGQQWVEDHKHAAEGGGDGGGGDDRARSSLSSAARCQACHGTDYRGTVLSRALGDRNVDAFGTKTFWKGYQIGCYTCHNGPGDDDRNPNHPPQVDGSSTSTGAGQGVSVILQASDADGDSLTLRVVGQGRHGRAGISGRTLTYVPDPGFAGTDAVTFAAWDGMADSNLGTLTVSVTGTPCTLSCSAGVPASADQGVPIQLTADAIPSGCSGTPAYSWSFGDGGTSNAQSPQHTYALAGTYAWSVTASLNGAFCTTSGSITILGGGGGGCTIECTATAPAGATAGELVAFTSNVTPSGDCGGSPAFSWSFGDGGRASAQNPQHAYTAPGTYRWSVTAAQDGATCSKGGTITVSPESGDGFRAMLVASHARGKHETGWRTDLALFNPGASAAPVQVSFKAGGQVIQRSVTLAAENIREWIDVVKGWFGVDGDASGAVTIESQQPLVVSSRTYTRADDGGFGQFFPPVTESQALGAGELGSIPQIKRNSKFRTNIGFLNFAAGDVRVRVRLYGAEGERAGSDIVRTVPGRGWLQVNDVFGASGAGDVDLGRASVEVLTAGGKVWAYASLIDQKTGDPITIPVEHLAP